MLYKIIKILATVLLFLAIARMPYDYYNFMRIAVFVSSLIVGYSYYRNNNLLVFFFLVCAVVFNPLIKVTLHRSSWIGLDIMFGILFLACIFIKNAPSEKK